MATHSAVSSIETGILLEAGTNELEILVLQVGEDLYGVNVAKVREVLPMPSVTVLPQSHPAVEGTAQIRGQVVQVVNLKRFLDGDCPGSQPQPGDKMMIMEFNQEFIAFRVHGVDQIWRNSWDQVRGVPQIGGMHAPVTGVVTIGDRLILMLDFESIGAAIGMSSHAVQRQHDEVQAISQPEDAPIVFADDSKLICEMISDSLTEAGFQNIRGFADGADAWKYLVSLAAESDAQSIRQKVSAIITDVEMPQMDGLTLTRKIREHAVLSTLPVVIFSSIVSKDNRKKGEQVGASQQVAKPRYADLVKTVRDLLEETVPTAS